MIDKEYAAFLAWIEATAACGLLLPGRRAVRRAGHGDLRGRRPDERGLPRPPATARRSPRGSSSSPRARRDRCYPCHFDNKELEAPKWIATGPCELTSLTTMRNVLERGLVDLEDPAASLLLRKPLAESAGGVVHGGHDKFADVNDPAYVDIRSWIEREAACAP